jgi:hypothetical protein
MAMGLVGVMGVSACSVASPAPEHETPGWGELVEQVQRELDLLEPDPPRYEVDMDPVDPYADLTRSSPNAVDTNLADLVVGQCILIPYDENQDLMDVVQVVPCEEPHYGEVYATGQFTEEEYSDSFDDAVADACVAQFEPYVGITYELSIYYFDYSYVSEYGWDLGMRGWRCYITEYDYEGVGSVRGSGR